MAETVDRREMVVGGRAGLARRRWPSAVGAMPDHLTDEPFVRLWEAVMQTAAEKRELGDVASRVVEDPHRPGPRRVRLDPGQIPVWALIGQAKAISEARCAEMTADAVALELAHDYGITPAAVRVALAWYEQHPHAIDTVLADNAAGFSPVRIALDGNVARRLATFLRSLGDDDVDSARELRRLGLRDPRVPISAVESGQTLVTHTFKGFRLLHSAWQILRNRREREVGAVAGFPIGLSGHLGVLVLPRGPLDEIAPALIEILESGIPLANRLLQWDRSAGWVEVND